MTTVVAWEGEVGAQSELVMASDSRFGGGERWDACAKIFDIGRSDALLGFAGKTDRALPLIFQVLATTRSYDGSQSRTLDLPKFSSHLERVMNAVLAEAKGGPATKELPECQFLLGGWSWSRSCFVIYRYIFNSGTWTFQRGKVRKVPSSIDEGQRVRLYATIGDAGTKLTWQMVQKFNAGLIAGKLDYHPLEALYQQTLDPEIDSVGGPLQIAKVYKSIRVEHFATRTKDRVYISGRPVLPYGKT